MGPSGVLRVGYVVKRYPRYSETFIVNEILAHEANGVQVAIFSLRPPCDSHFQDIIARVQAPVTYLANESCRADDLWSALREGSELLPGLWAALAEARAEDVRDVYAGVVLACLARRQGLQHLHAHFATSATTVARLAARFAGIAYTFTAHAKDIFHESVGADDLRRKLTDAAAVITVSDYNRNYLRQQHGDAAARVRRIYNGLDLKKFAFFAKQNRPPRIVAVGRLVAKKGFADLIAACALLGHRCRDFTCAIIGEGEEEGRLREAIDQLGLHGKVQLLGPQPQSEVIRHIQESAVLAAPCVVGTDGNRDGLPTVLLEAMALGTPCVSTDVTGIPELVRDGATGLQVPQNDPPALAAALERLLDDPVLRDQLARQARHRIEEDFDVECNAAQLRAVFRESIAPAVQPPPLPALDALETFATPGMAGEVH